MKLRSILTRAVLLSASLLTTGALMFAHGDFTHVMGTVAKVGPGSITVKTAKGDVAVKFDAKTELTKDSKKVEASELTVGSRVVVDLPGKGKNPPAASIKIGVTEAPAADPHAGHTMSGMPEMGHDAHK